MLYMMTCQIKDKKHFWEHFQKALLRLPEGTALLFKIVPHEGKQAWVVWETDSEAELKRYLEKFIKSFGSIQFVEIDNDISEYMGGRRAA